jgi:DNA-binding NtrC family response regulator
MSIVKNILVLDDQVEVGELLSDVLEDAGHSVNCFTCPNDAKKFFQLNFNDVDLIITDYHLTYSTTGLDVIRFCHGFSETPYILISGNMNLIKDNYNKNEIAKLNKPFCNDVILQFAQIEVV